MRSPISLWKCELHQSAFDLPTSLLELQNLFVLTADRCVSLPQLTDPDLGVVLFHRLCGDLGFGSALELGESPGSLLYLLGKWQARDKKKSQNANFNIREVNLLTGVAGQSVHQRLAALWSQYGPAGSKITHCNHDATKSSQKVQLQLAGPLTARREQR